MNKVSQNLHTTTPSHRPPHSAKSDPTPTHPRQPPPLTLEEGLAIATQHPDWLEIKNGFNLLGSRSADGRVPSIWMSQNAPRLGAVWPNSRHTWLGNAYCMARRGVSLFH